MSDIARYTGNRSGLAASNGGSTANAGSATSFEDLTFAGAAPSLHDLPGGFFSDAGAPALPQPSSATAGGCSQSARAVKIGEGRYQVREFWHVFGDSVVFTRALRSLKLGDDGKLRPNGEWKNAERTTYMVTGQPPQKANMVDDTLTDASRGHENAAAGEGVGAGVKPEHAEGAFAQSALPAKVRMWLNQQVPAPQRWLGNVLRFNDGSETVDVLRGTESGFVTVHATRKVGSPSWELTRRKLDVVGSPQRHSGMPSSEPAQQRQQLTSKQSSRLQIGRK